MGNKASTEHAHQYNDHGVCACGEYFQDRGLERGVEAEVDGSTDFSLDPYVGGSFNNKPIFSLNQIVAQIDSGRTVPGYEDGTITYSFLNAKQGIGWMAAGHYPGRFRDANGEFIKIRGSGDTTPFSPEQEAAAREAIQLWDDIVALDFVEVNGNGVGAADMIFQNTSDTAQAFAYYPGSATGWWDGYYGDVFIRTPEQNWTNQWFTPGGYGNTTLIHEIGHAVGLSHPGAYNFTGAPLSYAANAEYAQDSEQYTIMSYWGAEATNPYGVPMVDWSTFFFNNPQTPLLHDIFVLQQKYGADPDTRSGDSTYGFNVSGDVTMWVYNFAENPYPYLAIYDAGGNDTIDASGFTNAGQYIDLNDGAFSSIGNGVPTPQLFAENRAEINALSGQNNSLVLTAGRIATVERYMGFNEQTIEAVTGIDGIYASNFDNVAIAYGTVIENAIGGQMRDALIGNEVANFLDGQGGNDIIFGNDGDDTIVGGLGNDEIIGGNGADTMSGNAGADSFVLDSVDLGDIITDFNGSEGDTIDLSYFADELGADLSFIGDAAFSGAAGEVRYENGTLEVSFGGDSVADYSATLANNADVDASMLALAMTA